ncbi:MAG: hypothetical protein LBC80_01780 [Treponema sp.]|jgi:hypothetical protein|nr:hypothetical protein [Treponema sp.]
MIQLYFLSILCSGVAGYVLFAGGDTEAGEKNPFSINNPTFYLVLGIVSGVTGFLKLLSPLPSSMDGARGIIIFGDLFPALAGIVAAIVLIFGIYRQSDSLDPKGLDRFGASLLVFRKPIGLGLMIIGVVHFLFGELIFL